MSKKKSVIFKYFDKNCYGELKNTPLNYRWLEPIGKDETFAYDTNKKSIFYGKSFYKEVNLMFSINQKDFKSLFLEWFDNRYGLPVSLIM